MSTMTVHLVGFLTANGHPAAFAATVAGLLGLLSVTGRLLLTAAQRRIRLTTIVAAVFTVQTLAALSLPLIGGSTLGAVIAVTGFGLGFGVASLVAPVLLTDRYRTTAYASIAGLLAAAVTLAKATAPLGAAALATQAGYPTTMTTIAAACVLAAIGILARSHSPGPITAIEAVSADATPEGHDSVHTSG
jgi:predicted MFS family arabinose efflux permease